MRYLIDYDPYLILKSLKNSEIVSLVRIILNK